MLVGGAVGILLNLNSLPSDSYSPISRRVAREGKTVSSLCCCVFIDRIWLQQVYELIA